MRKLVLLYLLCASIQISFAQTAPKTYTYSSVPNDPLNVRIYQLQNGLTVYMSIYKAEPRIQTAIAVRAGSKNDPKDATGLAHYLEHMLFKGTSQFGTKDYATEKKYLDEIEKTFEVYRKTTDEKKRKAIYRTIDSLSGIAAKYAIANEYDKMTAAIGGQGDNAYTWVEQTVYITDIPSNQLNNWLAIQAERFRQPVLRIFHTELEAVYEEKNIGMDNDGNQAFEALLEGLWQKHTYGTQTTIGTVEHLKNPSITEIKKYYNTHYVPNNMAICLSGDIDPDKTIRLIDEKFGSYAPKPVPSFTFSPEDEIKAPIVKTVYGPNAENIMLGYRIAGGAGTTDADLALLVSKILSNDAAGLIDLNLNQKQKLLGGNCMPMVMKDYSCMILGGSPKEGQTLDQVKELLLEQIEKLKKGEFPDWLPNAIVNNLKAEEMDKVRSNMVRTEAMVNSFVTHTNWAQEVNTYDRLEKITKQQIMDFTKKYFSNNYVAVYKKTGESKNNEKVVKPQITPVEVNRNDQSPFVKTILSASIETIQPEFVDFKKEIKKSSLNTLEVLSCKNTENDLFSLSYRIPMGQMHDKRLPIAAGYFSYLGTTKYTAEQLQEEFYKIACTYNMACTEDEVIISVSGLNKYFEKALTLFETTLNDCKPDKEALDNLVLDLLKVREDNKLDKGFIAQNALRSYGVYGPKSPFTNILSEEELKKLDAVELTTLIKNLTSYKHTISYFGPSEENIFLPVVTKIHGTTAQKKDAPAPTVAFTEKPSEKEVFVIDYDMKQAEIVFLNRDLKFSKENIPAISMFNEYYGAGMSSIVFQEIRESKALAYSAGARYTMPRELDKHHYVSARLGTQADKLPEAMSSMMELLTNMTEAENTFSASKESILQQIRTNRMPRQSIIPNYLAAKKLGYEYDINKDIYAALPALNLQTTKEFFNQHIKGKNYTILVLGKKDLLDIKTLEKYGKVNYLTLKDIFGY
ncbi:MAG: insulinase family protein [Bacteroidetes bacterium]|nr:insulinase family protein [Bacteroidota bacterium]